MTAMRFRKGIPVALPAMFVLNIILCRGETRAHYYFVCPLHI